MQLFLSRHQEEIDTKLFLVRCRCHKLFITSFIVFVLAAKVGQFNISSKLIHFYTIDFLCQTRFLSSLTSRLSLAADKSPKGFTFQALKLLIKAAKFDQQWINGWHKFPAVRVRFARRQLTWNWLAYIHRCTLRFILSRQFIAQL